MDSMIRTEKEISSYLDKFGLGQIFSKLHQDDFSLVHIPKGDILCLKGEEMKYMYLIVEGKAKIYAATLDDKRLILRFQKAPEIIGDIEFIEDPVVHHTVEAGTDCKALKVSYEVIRRKVGDDPAFLAYMLRVVTRKLRGKTDAVTFNLLYPVEVRVASYLLSIANSHEDKPFFHDGTFGSSLSDIADMIGTSYRHLNRVLKKLCMDGIIDRSGGKLFVKDMNALARIAEHNIYE